MNDLELNDFTLTYFPKKRKVIVFSHGNIYQTESNFKIALILRSIDSNETDFFLVYLNLKEILAFPIGTVIDNQERIGLFAGSRKYIQIDLENNPIEQKMLFQIPPLKKFIEDNNVPDKINNFNAKFHMSGQWYYVLKETYTGKNIYIPHYEIGRKFYFTSFSMTRQILSASLKEGDSILDGLYKDIKTIDLDTEEITLCQNANTGDAENIYRFATNPYALNAWYQVRRNLTASAKKFQEKKEQYGFSSTGSEMKLKVDFPVKEIINIYGRVKELEDGSLLLLKILEEDTSYDFERLFIKIERKNKPDEPVGVINKEKVDKKDLSRNITSNIPFSGRKGVELHVDLEDKEKKLGLEGKEVIRSLVQVEDEGDITNIDEETGDEDIDLSSEESSEQGDKNTTSSSTNTKDGEKEDTTDYLTLEDFKNMLFSCAQENKEFSYNVLIDDYLPQKPEEDKDNRRKWKKAKLLDGETKRKYLGISITFNNRNFMIIEIQRDTLVKGLSTLIIYKRDNEKIDEELVYLIAKNFVYNNGRWLHDFGVMDFEKIFFEHPKGENRNSLKDWYQRLINRLSN
jgi:hypothetical protein